jgi:hypothetical protein
MKRIVVLISMLALLLAGAAAALAAGPPGVKYLQPPDYQYGVNIPSTLPFPIVADDWLCDNPKPVTDIHWWGSYLGWSGEQAPGATPPFQITVYTDIPAGGDVAFSRPGPAIRGWVVNPSETAEGLEPLTQDMKFYYSVLLPQNEWFLQEGGQNIYWLSIAALNPIHVDVPGAPGTDYYWGWETTSADPQNDLAVQDLGNGWQPIRLPTGAPLEKDMAFELTTVPLPGAVWLLGSGLVGLAGLRRRRR